MQGKGLARAGLGQVYVLATLVLFWSELLSLCFHLHLPHFSLSAGMTVNNCGY